MKTTSSPNLFEKAILENQLASFLKGEGIYFLPDREYGTHWVLGVWLYHIAPLVSEGRHEEHIPELFRILLREEVADLEAMDTFLYHLQTFYYALSANRLPKNYIVALEKEIKEKLSEYRTYLRSAGKTNELKTFTQTIQLVQKNNGLMDFENGEQA